MTRKLDPFKIDLLIPTRNDLQGVKKVVVMDIMEGFTKNFHPDGLFSTEIFGKVGEERRSKTFGYLDLNLKIFHPLIYKVIVDLKALYGEIMAGKTYAIFDEQTSDFVKSNIAEGETGYEFFIKHFPKLKFEKSNSISRRVYIQFVEKYREDPYIQQLVVMPAGLRDYVVDEDGKPSEDEINGMYRSIMAISSLMQNVNTGKNPEMVDASRANLQLKVYELYRYIMGLLLGKGKLIQGSFLSRKVSNTTRNVISSYIPNVKRFGDPTSVGASDTVMGLYQYLRDIMPLVVFHLKNKYMYKVFSGTNTDMTVVDPKTLKKRQVGLDSKAYNTWMTYDGIEKICDNFSQENMRHYPVLIGQNYLGLVYKGDDMTFKFIQDIDEVPEGRDKKSVTPITMAELLYMAVYEEANESYGWSTRYPVTQFGSTFPGTVYLKTTSDSEARYELDDSWEKMPILAKSFPVKGSEFFNSMSVPVSRVPRAGADFDGDMMNHYCVLTTEAKAEVKKLLGSKEHYMTIDGQPTFSLENDYIKLALAYLTN